MALTPKTLDECAAEFRAMFEDAIRQQHFEMAANCKGFLLGIEAAQAHIAKLREDLEVKEIALSTLRKFGTVYVFPSDLDCAANGETPPIEAFEKYDVSQLP